MGPYPSLSRKILQLPLLQDKQSTSDTGRALSTRRSFKVWPTLTILILSFATIKILLGLLCGIVFGGSLGFLRDGLFVVATEVIRVRQVYAPNPALLTLIRP